MAEIVLIVILIVVLALSALVPAVIAYGLSGRFFLWWIYAFFLLPIALVHALYLRIAAILRYLFGLLPRRAARDLPRRAARDAGVGRDLTFAAFLAAAPFWKQLEWWSMAFLGRNYLILLSLIYAGFLAPSRGIWLIIVATAVVLDLGRNLWARDLNIGPEEMYAQNTLEKIDDFNDQWVFLKYRWFQAFCAVSAYYVFILVVHAYTDAATMRGYYSLFAPFHDFMANLSAVLRNHPPIMVETGHHKLAATHTHLTSVLTAARIVLVVAAVFLMGRRMTTLRLVRSMPQWGDWEVVSNRVKKNAEPLLLVRSIHLKKRKYYFLLVFFILSIFVGTLWMETSLEPYSSHRNAPYLYIGSEFLFHIHNFLFFAGYVTVPMVAYLGTTTVRCEFFTAYLEAADKEPFNRAAEAEASGSWYILEPGYPEDGRIR